MTSESMAVSLVQGLPLMPPAAQSKGYYRSKLFIASLSTNPLMAASGPLFSLLERLSISSSLPVLSMAYENIAHELRAFHSRLLEKNYSPQIEALAHYLLTATIDELLSKNYCRIYGQAPEFDHFATQTMDNISPKQGFFDIINFVKEQPLQYLDIIELAYYCLLMGFEGNQQGKPQGRFMLEHLMDELFQLLKNYKAHKTHHLFKDIKRMELTIKPYKPWLMLSFIIGGLLLGSFLISFTLLESKAKSVQFGHAMIDKLDN